MDVRPSSSSPAIETSGLSKTYRGGVEALVGLDMRVERGEVFGLLGPNGAGKSTLIRVLLDLIRPTAGRATLLGVDSRAGPAVRARIGYVPGDPRLVTRLTGRRQLTSLARMSGGVAGEAMARLVERFEAPVDRPIRDMSRGNRQKIALIQAFAHEPELLLLDEPTSGLDPLAQDEFRRLAREQADAGRTVLLSSHSLDEVQHVADRVGIIRAGRLVAVETVEGLLARSVRHVVVRFAKPTATAEFTSLPSVRDVTADGAVMRMRVQGRIDALVKMLAHYEVVDLTSTPADLEEIFLAYYREGGNGDA
jgi:ABC-2 type transport system ATP-binding protein